MVLPVLFAVVVIFALVFRHERRVRVNRKSRKNQWMKNQISFDKATHKSDAFSLFTQQGWGPWGGEVRRMDEEFLKTLGYSFISDHASAPTEPIRWVTTMVMELLPDNHPTTCGLSFQGYLWQAFVDLAKMKNAKPRLGEVIDLAEKRLQAEKKVVLEGRETEDSEVTERHPLLIAHDLDLLFISWLQTAIAFRLLRQHADLMMVI